MTPSHAAVSAPGKLILMGEHAAVYGRPALVAALGLRTRAKADLSVRPEERQGLRDGKVEIELPTLGHATQTAWPEVLRYTEDCRAAWRRWRDDPTARAFGDLLDGDPARVVKLALGEAAAKAGVDRPPPIRLEVSSDIPAGSGLGSSASVAVATAAALLGLLEGPQAAPDRPRIGRIVLEVERRQHGTPSGVDHSTVLLGGVRRFERTGEDLNSAAVAADAGQLSRLRVFDSGAPAESTGEVVAAVRRLREADPEAFAAILRNMEAETKAFETALTTPAGEPEILRSFAAYQRCLEAIGVVPKPVREVVRRVEGAGGAAKISGAGALSPDGAGALLVYWPGKAESAAGPVEDFLGGYSPYRAEIGAPGLESEAA